MFILGSILGVYIFSFLFILTFFKKLKPPKKQIYSISISYPIVSTISAFGSADGGDPNYLSGFIDYGVGSIILIIIYLIYFKFENDMKNTSKEFEKSVTKIQKDLKEIEKSGEQIKNNLKDF